MLIKKFYVPGLAIQSYLVYDEENRKGVFIDPTREIEPYLLFAAKERLDITDILETHVHADFMSGAPELKAALGGKALIHCSAMGGVRWIPAYADRPVYDRDQLRVGSGRLEAWHTPGHTEEHLIWVLYDEKRNGQVPEVAFTGDLLFVGSVGRPDLAGEEKQELLVRELYKTLFERLQALPDFVEILPCHGAGSLCGKEIGARNHSTWGYEKQSSACLREREFEEWRNTLLQDVPAAPDYFFRMKQLNKAPSRQQRQVEPLRVQVEDLIQPGEEAVLIDTRTVEAFVAGHVKGALSIPFEDPHFALWAGMFLRPDQKLFLILNRPDQLMPVMHALRLIGIDAVDGFCLLSDDLKEKALLVSGVALPASYLEQNREIFYILDVRTPAEWQSGHLTGAHLVELAALPHHLKQIPQNEPIAVVCRSGRRAQVAASYLMKHGFDRAIALHGGMLAWQQAGFPVVKRDLFAQSVDSQ